MTYDIEMSHNQYGVYFLRYRVGGEWVSRSSKDKSELLKELRDFLTQVLVLEVTA